MSPRDDFFFFNFNILTRIFRTLRKHFDYRSVPLSTVVWHIANRTPQKASCVASRVTVARCEPLFTIYMMYQFWKKIKSRDAKFQVGPWFIGVNQELRACSKQFEIREIRYTTRHLIIFKILVEIVPKYVGYVGRFSKIDDFMRIQSIYMFHFRFHFNVYCHGGVSSDLSWWIHEL